MAYGTTSQFAVNTGIQPIYAPSFEEIVYKNNEFLGLTLGGRPLFEPLTSQGDTSFRWKIHSAANTSVAVFTEGAGAPQPVAQTYLNAAVDYVYFWAWVRISGHARDAIRGAAVYSGLDVLDLEMTMAFEDLRDLMNTTFMGSGNSGLEVAVDDSTNYAGLTRSSYAQFQATETALSGALTRTHLMDQSEFARDNNKGSQFGKNGNGIILTAHNQVTNYRRLTGELNASNSSARWNMDNMGARFDVSPSAYSCYFEGVPVVGIGDFTDTVLIGLDTRSGKNLLVTHRPFNVRGPQMVGDDDVWELSWAGVIVDKNPRFDWKSTGVTA